MPYIEGLARRDDLEPRPREPALNGGELNFQIGRLIDRYVEQHGLSYVTIEAITAACAGASDEFYHRFGRSYEDLKLRDNGEVFEATQRIWRASVQERFGTG